jgi:hypothetical protein
MNKLISPENRWKKLTFFHKFFRKISPKYFNKVDFFIRSYPYKKNYDSRELDFDWKGMQFNRIALVNKILTKFGKNAKYLEIGCAGDSLFNSIPLIDKVGIDPESGGTIKTTSDNFFSTNKDFFNVVFIDGLHEYHQVQRDFENALESVPVGGVICFHDMIPRNWIEANIPAIHDGSWTGDVWKIAFELINSEGIEFKIIPIDHGIGVVKKVAQSASLAKDNKKLDGEGYSFLLDNFDDLPITSWNEFVEWI